MCCVMELICTDTCLGLDAHVMYLANYMCLCDVTELILHNIIIIMVFHHAVGKLRRDLSSSVLCAQS